MQQRDLRHGNGFSIGGYRPMDKDEDMGGLSCMVIEVTGTRERLYISPVCTDATAARAIKHFMKRNNSKKG